MSALAIPRHIPAAILDSVPFISILSDQQRHAVLPFTHYNVHRRGSFIIRAGERADKVYILVGGRANVILDDGTGREILLCTIGRNEFFGEMGAIDGKTRSAAVQCAEACEVLSIPAAVFAECLKQSPQATMLLTQCLVARLRATDVRVTELAFADVTIRVARALLQGVRQYEGEWLVELGTEQIARIVAASREMVSRVLKRLQERRLIRREKRAIVLIDRKSLEDIAHGDR